VPRKKQGCQMVYFQTPNPNLGNYWRALEWKMLVLLMAVWNILRPVSYVLWPFHNLVIIWYIFPRFGISYQKIWQPWKEGKERKGCFLIMWPSSTKNNGYVSSSVLPTCLRNLGNVKFNINLMF
jgi:hypothetical protein